MANSEIDPIPNTRLTSTTWVNRLVKTVEAPAGEIHSAKLRSAGQPRRRAARGLSYRRRVQVVLWYQGGSTAQVLVRCNGRTRRFDGDVGIFDVLSWSGWAQGLH